MKKTMAMSVAALACAGLLRAHHNGRVFDPTPIWVTALSCITSEKILRSGDQDQVQVWLDFLQREER